MSPAPWFKFFAADWLLSPSVRLMTAEQRGIYVQLLAEQWYSGNGLPSDDLSLCRLAACTREEWERSKTVVLTHFPPDSAGRLCNDKLRTLQLEALTLSQERSEAGKQGNQKRWSYRNCDHKGITKRSQTHRDSDSDSDTDSDTDKYITQPKAANPLSKPQQRKSTKTPIPENFAVSERVSKWAGDKGHTRLPEHLESFVSYAKRSGKTYADWDEALMTAIRENWAKLPEEKPNSKPFDVLAHTRELMKGDNA